MACFAGGTRRAAVHETRGRMGPWQLTRTIPSAASWMLSLGRPRSGGAWKNPSVVSKGARREPFRTRRSAVAWGSRSPRPLARAILSTGRRGATNPVSRRMPVSSWAWLVPALLLAALVGSAIATFADAAVAKGLFSWLPAWYLRPIDFQVVGRYSATAWVVTLAAYMMLNGFAGPIVEELYFRGFLLPRMDRFGRWAPLINVTLFSPYLEHLFSRA